MTSLNFLSATELAEKIKSQEITPLEVVQATLDRIEKLNNSTHAYITVLRDEALAEAEKATEEIKNGEYKGPLHGMPIGVKDNYETAGVLTTGGSVLYENNIPDITSYAVQNMLDAGAIMIGKLNLHPLGFGLSGTNPTYGHAVNPWDTDYMPGSSSSGSATALGAGMGPLITGSDTFGSIRVPAAMSGIYGIKPTYGLISAEGLMPLAPSLDMAGPMTRTVADNALMLNYMAGYNENDPTSVKKEDEDYTENLDKGIENLKIAVPTYFLENLDKDIEDLFNQAVDKLQELGASVEKIDIPELSLTTFAEYTTLIAESSSYNYDVLQDEELSMKWEEDPRVYSLAGAATDSNDYVKAQQARRLMIKALKEVFESYDAVAGPTIPMKSEPYQDSWLKQNLEIVERGIRFTGVASTTGLPAFSVPMGLDSDNMPAGMQFIGNHFDEKLLYQIGSTWEKTKPLGNFRYEDLEINQDLQ